MYIKKTVKTVIFKINPIIAGATIPRTGISR